MVDEAELRRVALDRPFAALSAQLLSRIELLKHLGQHGLRDATALKVPPADQFDILAPELPACVLLSIEVVVTQRLSDMAVLGHAECLGEVSGAPCRHGRNVSVNSDPSPASRPDR